MWLELGSLLGAEVAAQPVRAKVAVRIAAASAAFEDVLFICPE